MCCFFSERYVLADHGTKNNRIKKMIMENVWAVPSVMNGTELSYK